MIPYFFVAGHWNYGRESICCLRSMGKLSGDILNKFMKVEHVMRHQKGLWDGILSDMMIETTYMKYGKGPSGMIGIVTKPQSVQIWANSHHMNTETCKWNTAQPCKTLWTKWKSYNNWQRGMSSKGNFRAKLQKFMSTCIHPFGTSVKELCNIYSGETWSEKTSVNKSYEIRTEFMLEFQRGLPEGFHSRSTNRVISMVKGKKTKKKDEIFEMYKNRVDILTRYVFIEC